MTADCSKIDNAVIGLSVYAGVMTVAFVIVILAMYWSKRVSIYTFKRKTI